MEQNINLVQNLELQKASKYLSRTFIILIISSFFAILLAVYFADLNLYTNSQKNLERIHHQQITSSLQLEAIKKEITKLDKTIAVTSGIASELKTKPFTFYLEQLAHYTPRGIWLEKINFDNENQLFIIEGKTLQPLLMSEYIKNVDKEQIFSGNKMTSIKLQKDSKEPITSFILSNIQEHQ